MEAHPQRRRPAAHTPRLPELEVPPQKSTRAGQAPHVAEATLAACPREVDRARVLGVLAAAAAAGHSAEEPPTPGRGPERSGEDRADGV